MADLADDALERGRGDGGRAAMAERDDDDYDDEGDGGGERAPRRRLPRPYEARLLGMVVVGAVDPIILRGHARCPPPPHL